MTTLTFQITSEGRLPDGIRSTLARVIPTYIGKTVELILNEYRPKSSDKQRAYYFSVIIKAFQDYFHKKGTWYDTDDLHDMMMREIGGFKNPYVNPFTGEPDSGRTSYKKLTKPQCEGYHILCRQWLAEHGVDCPEPNEPPCAFGAGRR